MRFTPSNAESLARIAIALEKIAKYYEEQRLVIEQKQRLVPPNNPVS
jgi:hypothetical protein